jgi:hypothetical protein
VLLSAEMVDDSAVGIAGVRTESYSAFATLWHRDDARASGERLVAEGTPAGKVYGLLLLRKADPAAAARAAEAVGGSTEAVGVMRGCIVSTYKLSEIAAHAAEGQHIIQLPGARRRAP